MARKELQNELLEYREKREKRNNMLQAEQDGINFKWLYIVNRKV
ncbi:hypothetical protein [Zunongwangia profunda]|nr:hypothetical protein [Zunongwangia profunda]